MNYYNFCYDAILSILYGPIILNSKYYIKFIISQQREKNNTPDGEVVNIFERPLREPPLIKL